MELPADSLSIGRGSVYIFINILTNCNTETSFPLSNMSSTYNIRNTTTLLISFLYRKGSSIFCEKSNSLIVSLNRILQFLDACFNP